MTAHGLLVELAAIAGGSLQAENGSASFGKISLA